MIRAFLPILLTPVLAMAWATDASSQNPIPARAPKTKGVPIVAPQQNPGKRQPPSPEELQKRYDEEIALPFVAKGNWVLDYDEARARSKKEGKLILAYFSRSYAY